MRTENPEAPFTRAWTVANKGGSREPCDADSWRFGVTKRG